MGCVLVIEDEGGIQQLMQRIISRMGHEVDQALSGPQALEHARARAYDIILTDFTLPGEPTGVDLVQALRELQPRARMAVITGLADTSRAQALHELGVTHILRKPFDLSDLKQLVTELASPAPG